MDTARWSLVRSLLERAIDVDPAARARWIAHECGGDTELQREVEALLEFDARESGFEPPDPLRVARALADPAIGERIGPYELVQRVGEGGMGVVYLAKRVGAGFEQQVAIKLVKRGMDTEDVLRQFHRERALLSSLDHPCIARLYDGGATADGRPWFAMEYVQGEPLHEWCATRALSTRARLELFLRVCSAVQHAHQRLIVHRDLKPSNVLVTADGAPKLLDFGIAKLLDPERSSDGTLAHERRLTPDYASPEQLRGEPVTTATDVYSLGVLLYELLAGAHPFRGAGDGLVARSSPPKPSTSLREGSSDEHASRRARVRLDRDLDTITLTALAPEIGRRYPSVDALAADLRRHLERIPIHARPATAGYRLSRFVARNRLAVAATTAVIAALTAGLVAARAGYREAVAQRDLAAANEMAAKRETQRANSVLELTRRMLDSASPHDVRDKDYTLRRLLDEFRESARSWSSEPEVEASVRSTMGAAYRRLGLLDTAGEEVSRARALTLGSSSDAALHASLSWAGLLHDRGEYEQAVAELTSVIARTDAPRFEGAALAARGESLRHLGRLQEAEADLDRSLRLARSIEPHDGPLLQSALAALGQVCVDGKKFEEAERVLSESIELASVTYGPRSHQVASAHNALGCMQLERGELTRAEASLRAALAIERELNDGGHFGAGPMLNNLGRALTQRGEYAQARPLLEEALALARTHQGPDHPSVATDLSSLATVLEKLGDFAAAEAAHRESLAIRSARFGEAHADTLRSMNNLANVLQRREKRDEAITLLQRCIEGRRALLGPRDLGVATALTNLGSALTGANRLDEAVAAAREALEIARERLAPDQVELAAYLANFAATLALTGAGDEAVALQREALAIRRDALGDEHPDVWREMTNLAQTLLEHGDAREAEELLTESLRRHRSRTDAPKSALARTLHWSGVVDHRAGRVDDAENKLRESLALWRAMFGDAHANTLRTVQALVELLESTSRPERALELRESFRLGERNDR